MTTRRQFLRGTAGTLGLAALGALDAQGEEREQGAHAPRSPGTHFPAKAKACIFVFFVGGVSQVDLLDPKPTLRKLDGQKIPESFRAGVRLGQTNWNAPLLASRFPFKKYGQCGMEISELLPHLGSCADDIALVRSMHHEAFDHAPGELEVCTGKDQPGRPTIGAWLTYGLGSVSKDLPGYVVLLNGRSPKARELVWGSGFLPAVHQGVLFRTRGAPVLNLRPPQGTTPELDRAQQDAIGRLNALQQQRTLDPQVDARIAAYELAYRMQSAAPELCDLSRETKATLESYGDSDFARSLLLARRLVERGVRFVTVTHHEWDHHDNVAGGIPTACRQMDKPVAALLKDLKSRGLLDSTLVLGGTEFGRTAITQGGADKPGRDHHPHGYSVWLAGGGVKGGQVLGATDELSWRAVEDRVHVNDLHATLLHLFGLDHKKLTYRYQGLDFRLTDVAGEVVKKLLA